MAQYRCGGGGKKLVLLGNAGSTFDLTQYKGWKNFTVADNIILGTPDSGSASQSSISESINSYRGSYNKPTATYDSATGQLTTTKATVYAKAGNNYSRTAELNNSKVYLIY